MSKFKRDWYKTDGKLLTVLNYSAGVQSSTLLHMLIRGDIHRPANLLVLNADPGMENEGSYKYLAYMRQLAATVSIKIHTVPGPNLYKDILTVSRGDATRLDNPAYFTKKPNGKRGKLIQKCTQYYKITPMDRFMRRYMQKVCGISKDSKRIPEQSVHKWIGFALDEIHRISEPKQKYVRFVYPLIELRMDKEACVSYLKRNKLEIPPRSVCNACFANSLKTLKEMYEERPADWRQAVHVDNAVRDWSSIGVDNPVYVSDSLVPLKDLPMVDFKSQNGEAEKECSQTGYCFI
jgi:hypothetical protein